MKRHLLATVCATAALLSLRAARGGENLIPDGDFSGLGDGALPAAVSTDGGRAELFTEDATWNKCVKLMVAGVHTNADGYARGMASLILGADGKKTGFAVRPETTYEFSLDLKGGLDKASVGVVEWTGDGRWKDLRKVKSTPDLSNVRVLPTWTGFKGTFKTSAQAKRAALEVKLWSSSRWGRVYRPGEYVLVDNVRIVESARNLNASADSVSAPRPKAIASGDAPLEDFTDIKTGRAAPFATSVRVTATADAFVFDAVCRDAPENFTVPRPGDMWKGDCFEVWFGPVGGERLTSQFSAGIAGEKYASVNGAKVDAAAFDAKMSRTADAWTLRLTVPFASFGWKAPVKKGASVAFNVARYREKGRLCASWNKLKTSLGEYRAYGTLFLDSYGLGCTNRNDYETKRQALDTAALREKFERFQRQKFAVAPVPVTSDFEVPFLPPEIFEPPAAIRLKMAVNEWKSLPVAVANLTGRSEDYLVVIDHPRPSQDGKAEFVNDCATDFGLAGFPRGRMRVRRALKMKDSSAADPTLRLDPLPYADTSSSLTVAPKEAGVTWFEFDTRGVKPGVYRGNLRVIPLCEFGKFAKVGRGYHDVRYEGEMKTVPVELEVQPIVLSEKPVRPAGFYMDGINEEGFELETDLGAKYFTVTPWHFTYERDAKGDFDFSRPKPECRRAQASVRRHLEWGRKFGNPPFFSVTYAAVYAFRILYNPKKDPAVDERLWPQFVRGIRLAMDACGVPTSQWEIETYDEPAPGSFPDMLRMHRLAKAAEPQVQLMVTLGKHGMTSAEIEELARFTDAWIGSEASNWSNPDYADFLRREIAKGKRVGHYVCQTSMRLSLDGYYRRRAWVGERYGTTGDMMYQFRDSVGPLGTLDYKVPTAGGIVYAMFDRIVPSIRYMAIREGLMDVKYLAKLREVGAGDPKVEAFVREAVRRVTVTRGHDPAESDRVREEVRRMILERIAK